MNNKRKRTPGRAYSKQFKRSIESIDGNSLKEFISKIAKRINNNPKTFNEKLEKLREQAKLFLEQNNLPTDRIIENKLLYLYLVQDKRLEPDSIEVITSEILELISNILDQTGNQTADDRLKYAYMIGQKELLFNVYSKQKPSQTINAKKPRNILIPLIEKLAKREGKPSELWYDFISMMEAEDLSPKETKIKGEKGVSFSFYKKSKGEYTDDEYTYINFRNRLKEFRN